MKNCRMSQSHALLQGRSTGVEGLRIQQRLDGVQGASAAGHPPTLLRFPMALGCPAPSLGAPDVSLRSPRSGRSSRAVINSKLANDVTALHLAVSNGGMPVILQALPPFSAAFRGTCSQGPGASSNTTPAGERQGESVRGARAASMREAAP